MTKDNTENNIRYLHLENILSVVQAELIKQSQISVYDYKLRQVI